MKRWVVASGLVVVLMSSLTVSVRAQLAVMDVMAMAKQMILNQMMGQQHDSNQRAEETLRRLARRLLIPMVTYLLPDGPRWRTYRVADAIPETEAFLGALNGGGGTLADLGPNLPAVDTEDVTTLPEDVQRELALHDLRTSALLTSANQTGVIRGDRKLLRELIAALERDMVTPGGSSSRVADHIAVAVTISARQAQERAALLMAVTDQLIVDVAVDRKIDRDLWDLEAQRLRRQVTRTSPTIVAGVSDALVSWRQP